MKLSKLPNKSKDYIFFLIYPDIQINQIKSNHIHSLPTVKFVLRLLNNDKYHSYKIHNAHFQIHAFSANTFDETSRA